jgi:hypothetical protein
MLVILRWTCPQTGPEAEVRIARFKRVLRAAQRTQRYQSVLENAGLATAEALASIDSVEQTLKRLPAIELLEFRSSPAAFESPGGTGPTPQAFRSPLDHTPKTAILMPGFEQTSRVKVMAQSWSKHLKRFGASALAAPLTVLREVATAVETGRQEIQGLKHFVIPFTGGEQGELAEEDRERFWRVFQVPLFEQRLGFDGCVVAYECEAHSGLHILPERAAFEEAEDSEVLLTSLTDLRYPTLRIGTRLGGSIQHECCECGNAAARLVGLNPLAAAAAAC